VTNIDFAALNPAAFPAALVALARDVWRDRVRTEYQSIQVSTRLLGEALAAGETYDVHRMLIDTVSDELRHAEICAAMCRALGAEPPSPIDVAAPIAPLDVVPVGERLIASVISMCLVSETFSVGYLRDLEARCRHPVTRAVLESILGDESNHETFALDLVRRRLATESRERLSEWRSFTQRLVDAHLSRAELALAEIESERRCLDAWPEQELAELALMSPQRGALVCERTWLEVLAPRLRDLGLLEQ